MSLKSTVASAVRSIARRPPLSSVLFQPGIRRSLQSLPGLRAIYGGGWDLAHPFDRLNGTDTSGYIPAADLPGSRFSDERRHVYGGSQPSIVRAALRELPDLTGFTFVDLGAGKGRPALVAAGFPFQQVVGVELASSLVEIALRNAAIFQAQHPGFAPVRIVNGDAAAHPLPAGDLVVFLSTIRSGGRSSRKGGRQHRGAAFGPKRATPGLRDLLQPGPWRLLRRLIAAATLLRWHDPLRRRRARFWAGTKLIPSSSGWAAPT